MFVYLQKINIRNMQPIKCRFCEYSTTAPNIFKKHLRFHHKDEFVSEKDLCYEFIFRFYGKDQNDILNIIYDYEDGMGIPDLSINYSPLTTDVIKKLLILNDVKLRDLKTSKQTKYYKDKYAKTIFDNYGVDNPSKSEVIKKKKIETMLRNYGRINNFSDKEIKKKAFSNVDFKALYEKNKITWMRLYGVDNISQAQSVKEKSKKSKQIYFSNMTPNERRKKTEICRAFVKQKSKLEYKIQSILNELGVEYVANKYIFGYNYDLFFKNKKILEIQGDYWHCNPNKYKENDLVFGGKRLVKDVWAKDERKKKVAIKKGYKMFYLWESEINKMSDKQIKDYLLKNIINGNNNIEDLFNQKS